MGNDAMAAMAGQGQEQERMRPWHTLTGDRAEHAERRRGTARVSDAARQSQAGAPAEAKDRLSRARLGAAGGGGGWRGVLLVSALLLSGRAGAVGATTCEKSTFAYSSGPCEGVEFKVARCAESADELKAWIKAKNLDATMTLDRCKIMWLQACAAFPAHTVVPKRITCEATNYAVCKMESFLSNCDTNDDCAGIPTVDAGAPLEGALWPQSGSLAAPALAKYQTCCSFYTTYNCNGGGGVPAGEVDCLIKTAHLHPDSDEIQMECPVRYAVEKGFCSEAKDCYNSNSAGAIVAPPARWAVATSLLLALALAGFAM